MALGRIALLASLFGLLCLKANSLSDLATCAAQRVCGDCIGTAGCSWCSTIPFTGTRCVPRGFNTTCLPANIEDPMGGVVSATEVPPTERSSNPVPTTNVNLQLRVGEPVMFRVQVTPLRNLPLDLYVLMDLPNHELNAFREVAGQIANRISDVTSNVRLGFGSFNDKFTRPFTRRLTSDDNYAFFHRITLTDNTASYDENVQCVRSTSNVDNPDNGLEGLAQVLTCEDVIGWRDRSATGLDRGLARVVLFMTDDAFHYSGEGQLAGILTPYNGRCLIDVPPGGGAVNFTRWNEFDYPSVGQIVNLLAEREVVVIFAVQENRLNTYQNLVDLISRKFHASVARLENNANAILELINREYRQMLQDVHLLPDTSHDLTFHIEAECPGDASLTRMGTACDNVALEDTVNFDVSVTLQSCDSFQNGASRTREHSVVSPLFGKITITYEALCDCTCEENAVVNSSDCNNRGKFTCGVCECNTEFCGPSCEFVIKNRSVSDCPRGGLDNTICSGRGVCDCFCRCDTPLVDGQMITGDACQCDNFRCPLDGNGQVCSGRGQCCNLECMCGRSMLGNFYRGDDCECQPEVEVCIDPNGPPGQFCSGHGVCGCTACELCPVGFTGPYCEIPENELQCNFIDHQTCIVSCDMSQNAPNLCNTTTACTVARSPTILFRDREVIDDFTNDNDRNQFLVNAVNTQLMIGVNEFNRIRECAVIDQALQCMYMYYLLTNSVNNVVLLAERPAVCAPTRGYQLAIPAYALAIVILAILLLILIILILVLVKILFLILKHTTKGSNKAPSQTDEPVYENPDVNITPSVLNHTISDPQSGCQDGDDVYDYVEITSREDTSKTQIETAMTSNISYHQVNTSHLTTDSEVTGSSEIAMAPNMSYHQVKKSQLNEVTGSLQRSQLPSGTNVMMQ